MTATFRRSAISAAVVSALACGFTAADAHADDDAVGQYLAGDFHNHTTCSDGSTSVKTLTRESMSQLDWFIQVGHSGNGARDCRIDDFLYFSFASEFSPGLWINSLDPEQGEVIKGDYVDTGVGTGSRVQEMWRWQSLQEFQLDTLITERDAPGNEEKEAFLGLEWVVPGHEHYSNTVATGQYDPIAPNTNALAQFEYCFARNSDDTSMGGGQGWSCELSAEGNAVLLDLFDGRPEEGIADYNSTLVGGINTDDGGDHVKSVAGVLWMQENMPYDGMAVGAHVERQGSFIPDDDEGFNVEHFRDYHTAAPEVAFGFETEPGHQAGFDRGTYNAGRPTAGLYTFGGTGCYGGAEATKPGLDFDGTPIDPARFLAGGDLEAVSDGQDPLKVVQCRPGVRTMWDAMLSEGRRFFYFASSDWHSRGSFGPLDFESTLDFWPGEYQENFTYIVDDPNRDPAQDIVDGLRSGNTYTVQGQLIDSLEFIACSNDGCATMGETLSVRYGENVNVQLRIRDPKTENRSPYKFNNPSLLQIGQEVPVNQPKVAGVQFIQGVVSEPYTPADPEYFEPLAPETTRIVASWDQDEIRPNNTGTSRFKYRVKGFEDMYIRARGTNMPAGTPNERDIDGNPLPDNLSDNIPCSDAACPSHVNGVLTADLEAWADLSFHTNPIFIEVYGAPEREEEDDDDKAKIVASN
ncbi:MAG: hypothetical protein AAF004_03495 [Pseudomonadota bacterium]